MQGNFSFNKSWKSQKKKKSKASKASKASKTETELHVDKKVGYIGKNVMQHDVGKLFLW